jgi:REP element-mobilizing transposase RayT
MQGPGTFFVTKCVEPRDKVIDDVVAAEVCSALCFYSEETCIYLGAFVVMLDHWHAVLATRDGRTISQRMKILDQWLSKQTKETLVNNWLRLTLQENRRSESGSHTASQIHRAWPGFPRDQNPLIQTVSVCLWIHRGESN